MLDVLEGTSSPSSTSSTLNTSSTLPYPTAASISRASPLSAILSHCHPTVSRTGFGTEGVVHRRTTSRPMAGVRRFSGLNDHTRPSSSVTVRVCTGPHLNVVYPNGLAYSDGRTAGRETRGGGTERAVTPFSLAMSIARRYSFTDERTT